MAHAHSIVSAVPEVPITELRRPPSAEKLEKALGDAGQPRANRAATVEQPEGTPGSPDDRSVLQQHVDFFDTAKTGVIFPWDTYKGFRRIGFGRVLSFLAMCLINGSMSYPSQKGWVPDPRFSIIADNIHRAKHGSDSETYDTEGRMVPQKLEETFSKYGDGSSLTGRQVWAATQGNRNVADPFGWIASKLEWGITWYLLKDADGKLSKEDVRSCIDGSIFYKLENSVKSKRAASGEAKKGGKKSWEAHGAAAPSEDASSPLLDKHEMARACQDSKT